MQDRSTVMLTTSKHGPEAQSSTGSKLRMGIQAIRQRWMWVEATIWTDAMLTALENGVKGGKWYSMMDKVYAMNTLWLAWQAVKRNKGAAGIDKISIARFEKNALFYLKELSEELRTGTYDPQGVKRVYIPKGGGKMRPLGIPTVKDRIAQAAVKLVIEPIFENEFMDTSYGFRPERGAKDALREVDRLIKEGMTWVVDVDFQSYFDTIPHDKLMECVKRHLSDGRILSLIEQWLEQKIVEECKEWIPDRGTPQGGVLSPVLANLYLHDLDVKMAKAGYQMIRYADDFVILTSSQEEAQTAKELAEAWAKESELIVHPEKTHIGNCAIEGEGFDFLGYRFEAGKRWVRKKSIQKFRDAVRAKTARTIGEPLQKVIGGLNIMLRGWYNYFKHVNKWGLGTFDAFVRRRLRAILRKREKRPGIGRCLNDHLKWPNVFFAKLGLFTMESTKVLEVASRSR
jgi:RNA-directed DNA polymerase